MMASYTSVARVLHWLIAGLIVSQYVLAELGERAEHANSVVQQLGLLANHKSIGMTIFALAIIRVLWRVFNAPPALPANMPVWQTRASSLAHIALYGFLFAMPLSGWLMSSASAYSVSWFNLFVFPDLIAASEANTKLLKDIHEWLSDALLVIAIVHIVAALKHHYIDKDDVLSRMASRAGWGLLVFTIVLTLGLFGRVSVPQKSAQVTAVESAAQQTLQESALPAWNIDYEDSYVEFSGDQAGAPFTGRWQKWQAKIQFDTTQLDAGRFDVSIEPASVFSGDDTRDDYIRDPDFFDVENHPQASFTAQAFSLAEQGAFIANAQLTMKELSHPVAFNFTVTTIQGVTVLEGEAVLDRFMWNIGTGSWADTTWIGKEIKVKVRVVTKL